jgi:dihydrofolate reductase
MVLERKVILYIAMSLDGYIAKEDGNIDFLSMVEATGEDYGYYEFIKTVDTVIMGRKTYDKVLSFNIPFPHADKNTYVITRKVRPQEGNINFYNSDLKALIQSLKTSPGKHIYIDGGAELVNELMKENLIDEFVISIIPIFLGNGIRLFKAERPELKLSLIKCLHFKKGLVQLHYSLKEK